MRFDLFDYQREAAAGCLAALGRARRDMSAGHGSAFALSAITGSGKTVIATAVIEAMLHGSADFGTDPDRRAAFLWVTDDPALNNQTRNKMLVASDLLTVQQLWTIENDFADSQLTPGNVYFLNVQKLSANAHLASGGSNRRQFSMWDILRNTINDDTIDLYLVLDEAHKGMRPTRDRATIVKQIIDGQPGRNPPIGSVWGISATPQRFTAAMTGLDARTQYPAVVVDTEAVRASGLVKDEIGVEQPDEKQTATTTLLREAVRRTVDYEQRWATYAATQNEQPVLPVLVVHVKDKPSKTHIGELVFVIDDEWPGLGPQAIVNVFGERDSIVVGSRQLRWVPPETIQGDADVRVVFAKEAISTGWDCPRAEVIYSERRASDATHIAQIVGRMVRQPLAHRIETDDTLNTVSCFLPLFKTSELEKVRIELEGDDDADTEHQTGTTISVRPATFGRNPMVPTEVFDLVETLPSLTVPDVLSSPLRRARKLAKLLADDKHGAMLADAGQHLTDNLNAELDGLAAKHKKAVADGVRDIETLDVAVTTVGAQGQNPEQERRQVAAHLADIDRDTRRIVRSAKEGSGIAYLKYRVDAAGDDPDIASIRTEIAALLRVDGVLEALDDAATKWVAEQLKTHGTAIKNTTGKRHADFLHVIETTSDPETVTVRLRDNENTATHSKNGDKLPVYDKHLFADDEGRYPARLNTWEREVIETEIARPSTVAWYRNPSRPSPVALRIAYQRDDDRWSSLQPDFVVISRRDDGTLAASIVDPHGDQFADARNKLQALADYAEQHIDQFVRIESIDKTPDGLRALDLRNPATRDEVRGYEGAEVAGLYTSDISEAFA